MKYPSVTLSPAVFSGRIGYKLRSLLRLSCGLLLLTASNAFATTTYPPIDSFLWGNTAVNAIGQTSKVSGKGWGYRYLPPKNFDPSKKYPVIIFLHGMGENAKDNASDNNAQLAAGGDTGNGALALVSLENQDASPLFFVAPQNASGLWAQGGPYLLAILNTLKTYCRNSIDEDRICLTGLSAGGFGTWDLPATTVRGVYEGGLHVGRRDLQDVADPLTRREAVPGVFGVDRRVRPAIHPDRAVGIAEEPGDRVRADLVRERVEQLRHAEVRTRSAHGVLRGVRSGLLFGLRQDRGIPRLRLQLASLVQWEPGIVTELGARNAVHLILVRGASAPFTGQVDLGVSQCGQQRDERQGCTDHASP